MSEEIDGQNKTEWTKRYQVTVDEYYDTEEEAQEVADKIFDRTDVVSIVEEIEISY